jgi:hypothetical protein
MAKKEHKNKKSPLRIVKLVEVTDLPKVPEEYQKDMEVMMQKCYDLVNHCMRNPHNNPMMIGAAFMAAARTVYLDTLGPEQTQALFQTFTDQVGPEQTSYTIH